MNNFENFKNICRVCLHKPKGSGMLLINSEPCEKLDFFEGFSQMDSPQYICEQCKEDLDFAHNFIKKMSSSNNKIKQRLLQILGKGSVPTSDEKKIEADSQIAFDDKFKPDTNFNPDTKFKTETFQPETTMKLKTEKVQLKSERRLKLKLKN